MCTPHVFCHEQVMKTLREGVPIDQVQCYLNQRSIQTARLYAKIPEQQIDKDGARTNPLWTGKSFPS
jgi:site-specific recombinase XerD